MLLLLLQKGSVILSHNASFSMHKTHHAELLMRKQSGGLGSAGSASCLQESMRMDEGSSTAPHAAHAVKRAMSVQR